MVSNSSRQRAAAPRAAAAKPRASKHWKNELLTEYTLGWLFIDIHRLLVGNFESRVRHLGLTGPQWRVLFTLRRADKPVTQTELAALTENEKAPLGKILDRLEAGGWIMRKNHPTDRRARLVYATSKIEKFADECAAAAKATFAQVLHGVRQGEVKELIAQLERLKRNLGGADD